MPFSVDRFIDLMRDLFNLMGWRWVDDRMARIYEEFMNGYELWDLKGAIGRMQTEDTFKYGKFKGHMDMVRAERMDREAFEENLKNDRIIQKMLKGQHNAECVNSGDCGRCRLNHCSILDRDCLNAVFAIMDGKVGKEEAHKILAKRYRGIGFEG